MALEDKNNITEQEINGVESEKQTLEIQESFGDLEKSFKNEVEQSVTDFKQEDVKVQQIEKLVNLNNSQATEEIKKELQVDQTLQNMNHEAEGLKTEVENVLYHFTFAGDEINKNGFESSKRIDEGIGAAGASLIGTYFFENPEDIKQYLNVNSKFMAANQNKEGSVIKAVLPSDAKILDSYADGGKEWNKVVNGFVVSFVGKPIKQYDEDWTDADTKKLSEITSKRGTPEYSKNLTKYLLEQGYDAIRLPSALGAHSELIVINEKLLSIVKGKDIK